MEEEVATVTCLFCGKPVECVICPECNGQGVCHDLILIEDATGADLWELESECNECWGDGQYGVCCDPDCPSNRLTEWSDELPFA